MRLTPSLTALALSLPLLAAACAPGPALVQTAGAAMQIQRETTLAISAEGRVTRAPDIATLSAGVQVEGPTAQEALAAQARLMTGVMTALREAGIADRDIQTSGLSLNPQYQYRDNQPPRVSGYMASNQVTVRVRDLAKVGETVDALVNKGGNTLNGISFGLDDPRAALDEARAEAMTTALARAELYAKAAGLKVKRIITITEGGGYTPAPPVMYAARMMESADASTPVSAGEVDLSISVNVTFELER
jgi:uncharacterized protein YggE